MRRWQTTASWQLYRLFSRSGKQVAFAASWLKKRLEIFELRFLRYFRDNEIVVLSHYYPTLWNLQRPGGTLLDGLNGDVRPDRVRFSGNFCLKRGIDLTTFCLKQGILIFKWETRTLKVAEHSFSARFSLSVMMQCSARNKHGADTALRILFCSLWIGFSLIFHRKVTQFVVMQKHLVDLFVWKSHVTVDPSFFVFFIFPREPS